MKVTSTRLRSQIFEDHLSAVAERSFVDDLEHGELGRGLSLVPLISINHQFLPNLLRVLFDLGGGQLDFLIVEVLVLLKRRDLLQPGEGLRLCYSCVFRVRVTLARLPIHKLLCLTERRRWRFSTLTQVHSEMFAIILLNEDPLLLVEDVVYLACQILLHLRNTLVGDLAE